MSREIKADNRSDIRLDLNEWEITQLEQEIFPILKDRRQKASLAERAKWERLYFKITLARSVLS